MHAQRFRAGMLAVSLVVALTACNDGGGAEGDDPQARLEAAAALLNDAKSVRFDVEGRDLPDSGTIVLSAEGVAVPPGSFDGEVRIEAGPVPATVAVVSVDGRLWAQLPFTDDFQQIEPDELDIGDPGKLVDPDEGVGRLLTSGSNVTTADRVRIDGDVYDQVTATLPGELVGSVLTIADPAAEVKATWALDGETGRLRQATLTGPFYDTGDEQTYVVRLDDYDAPVEISAPSD